MNTPSIHAVIACEDGDGDSKLVEYNNECRVGLTAAKMFRLCCLDSDPALLVQGTTLRKFAIVLPLDDYVRKQPFACAALYSCL